MQFTSDSEVIWLPLLLVGSFPIIKQEQRPAWIRTLLKKIVLNKISISLVIGLLNMRNSTSGSVFTLSTDIDSSQSLSSISYLEPQASFSKERRHGL